MTGPAATTELVLEHTLQGDGTVSLVARLGDTVIHADELNVTVAAERGRFVQQLCESRPGIDPADVETELLRIVGAVERRRKHGRPSQATQLIELAADAELFHAPGDDGECYGTVPVEDHRETWPLKGRGFRKWLRQRFWSQFGKAPNSQALHDAVGVLEGKALFDGPELPVFVRLAEHAGAIWIDLGDASHRAVEITTSGWRLVADPAVRFRRPRGMLPLPRPADGGSVQMLRAFVNVTADDDWMLVVGWLVAALRTVGPYPVLVVSGEQGSCKSSLCRVLRSLVDPNSASLRSEPREPRDLMIAATNGWVLAFDNLAHVPIWLSDAICRLATGGGFATRELYTDAEEILFDAQRPVVINGIEELATRSDLLDRAICLTLPTMPESGRRTEAVLWSEFEQIRPQVLGALCNAVSEALRSLPTVKLETVPRMADFATWVTAAEPALGWAPGTFLAAYTENREGANALALESSRLWPAVCGLMDMRGQWTGTAAELLTELEDHHTDERTRKRRDWPKTPRGASADLRRLAPNLRATGIDVRFEREAGGKRRRLLRLECLRIPSSQPSRQSRNPPGATETSIPAGRCRDGGGDQGLDNRPGESPVSAQPGPIRDGRDGRDGPILTHSGSEENGEWGEL